MSISSHRKFKVRRLSGIPTIFATAAGLAVLALVLYPGVGEEAHADFNVVDPTFNLIDTIAIDADTTGNTATSVASVEASTGDIAVGSTHDIDVVVDEIPALDEFSGSCELGDEGCGITGLEFNLLYDNTVVKVTGIDTNMLYCANQCSPQPLSDSLPDTDGNFLAREDENSDDPEGGEGVLIRITLECVGEGFSVLDLNDTGFGGDGIPNIEDAEDFNYSINNVVDGSITCVEFVTGDCPPAGTNVINLETTVADLLIDLDQPPDGDLETSLGAASFTGPATVTRGSCQVDQSGHEFIEIEMVSMRLCGIVQGDAVCLLEDPSLASTGIIRDLDPSDSTFLPASGTLDLFWEVFSPILNLTLHNCAGADTLVASPPITEIPPISGTYTLVGGDIEMCGSGHVLTVVGPVTMVLGPVGGEAEIVTEGASAPSADSPSDSGFDYTILASGLAVAALLAAIAGGWYLRRRSLG